MGRQKASLVRSAEALTALRAMLADVAAFDESAIASLALRATSPIADEKRALHLYDSFMASYAILHLSDLMSPEVLALQMREAHRSLDAIEAAVAG
jgi:hypothetical protein